jgi:hypothetical protein
MNTHEIINQKKFTPVKMEEKSSRLLEISSEIQILFNLQKFLYKLFMNIEFESSDMMLKPIEKEIISAIVKKKKFIGFQNIQFQQKFFNKAKTSNLRKKTEDGLKFVFKKAIRELKKEFKNTMLTPGTKLKTDALDKAFYGHYFGQISEHFNIPLESFFHFRNWKKRNSPHIPKSITKKYMSRLKLNSNFISKIYTFLHQKLINSFRVFNSKKIRTMVIKWEKIIEEFGIDAGLSKIQKMINSRGNKIPWTMSEVYHALDDTLDYLEKS